MQLPSPAVDDDDVMALFDDIIALLDSMPTAIQTSSDSTTHFLAEVEEAQATVVQLLKSMVHLVIDNKLIDKVNGAVVILSTEHHRLPTSAVEFLRLLEKLNTLRNTLLDSNRDL